MLLPPSYSQPHVLEIPTDSVADGDDDGESDAWGCMTVRKREREREKEREREAVRIQSIRGETGIKDFSSVRNCNDW